MTDEEVRRSLEEIYEYRRKMERWRYYVSLREPFACFGRVIAHHQTMGLAREHAQCLLADAGTGTVVTLYIWCPSMPLDYEYFVKHNGIIYSAQSRRYKPEFREEHGEPRDERYTDRWYFVRGLVDLYRPLPKGAK